MRRPPLPRTVMLADLGNYSPGGYRRHQTLLDGFAVDHGEVMVDAEGVAGPATDRAARLFDSPDRKQALARAADSDLAVIVSDRFRRDVVRDGVPRVDPEAYQRFRVESENFADEYGWVHVPRRSGSAAARRSRRAFVPT